MSTELKLNSTYSFNNAKGEKYEAKIAEDFPRNADGSITVTTAVTTATKPITSVSKFLVDENTSEEASLGLIGFVEFHHINNDGYRTRLTDDTLVATLINTLIAAAKEGKAQLKVGGGRKRRRKRRRKSKRKTKRKTKRRRKSKKRRKTKRKTKRRRRKR